MTKELVPKKDFHVPAENPGPRRDFLHHTINMGLGSLALGALANSAGSVAAPPPSALRSARLWSGNAVLADFEPLVGETLRLESAEGARVQARLIEARGGNPGRRLPRRPFSLVFDVPASLRLEDGYFSISHEAIGSMLLFMSPVDLPTQHRRLEAVLG